MDRCVLPPGTVFMYTATCSERDFSVCNGGVSDHRWKYFDTGKSGCGKKAQYAGDKLLVTSLSAR